MSKKDYEYMLSKNVGKQRREQCPKSWNYLQSISGKVSEYEADILIALFKSGAEDTMLKPALEKAHRMGRLVSMNIREYPETCGYLDGIMLEMLSKDLKAKDEDITEKFASGTEKLFISSRTADEEVLNLVTDMAAEYGVGLE